MARLTVRLPDSLHQQLTDRAAQEGVSLNQFLVYALARIATGTTASTGSATGWIGSAAQGGTTVSPSKSIPQQWISPAAVRPQA